MNLAEILFEKLPDEKNRIIAKLGPLADDSGVKIYLVGGLPRDLLLELHDTALHLDMDIVVEGDGIRFAEKAAHLFNASIITHPRFRTATLTFKSGIMIDFATARTEYYRFPAALPVVEPSSIENDLRRRDFSINSLAISINKENFAEILNPFRGTEDIKNSSIRALHDKSFIDDPTRIFRAIKFEQRLGFTLERNTGIWIKEAVSDGLINKLSGARIFKELRLQLSEKNPLGVLKRMKKLNMLDYIHPDIQIEDSAFRKAKKIFSEDPALTGKTSAWEIYFQAMTATMHPASLQELLIKLAIPKKLKKSLETRKTISNML